MSRSKRTLTPMIQIGRGQFAKVVALAETGMSDHHRLEFMLHIIRLYNESGSYYNKVRYDSIRLQIEGAEVTIRLIGGP